MGQTISSSGITIYVTTAICCLFLVVPIFMHLKQTVGERKENALFKEMLFCYVAYVLSDSIIVFMMEGCLVMSTIFYSIVIITNECSLLGFAFYWMRFGIVRINLKRLQTPVAKTIIHTIVAVVAAASVSSPFTGFFFSTSAEVPYIRGPFFFVLAGIIFFFNLLVPFIAALKVRKSIIPAERERAFSLVYFAAVPILTGIFQIFNNNTPIICMGLIIGIYFVFVDMLKLQIFDDSLTGMNNRRKAEHYIGDSIINANERPFYVYMIDVDYFKLINDQYGHGEGDHALQILGSALKKSAAQYHGFTARTGGDEFLLVVHEAHMKNPDEVTNFLNDMLETLVQEEKVPYSIRVSVGYTICNSYRDHVTAVLKRADEQQYKIKVKRHNGKMER